MGRKKLVPWNKGKLVGDKLPFSYQEVREVKNSLRKSSDLKGLVLYSIAIDSSLRSGDLLNLKGKTVQSPSGMIRQEVTIFMEKTGKRITFALFEETRAALVEYLQERQIGEEDYLFTGRWTDKPMSKRTFRRFVKRCAQMIGLNPEHYSGHSTRRTRVIHLAINQVADTHIAELLGVRVETVRHYIRRVSLQISKGFPM